MSGERCKMQNVKCKRMGRGNGLQEMQSKNKKKKKKEKSSNSPASFFRFLSFFCPDLLFIGQHKQVSV